MKIEILGTGCAKCSALEKVVKEAVSKIGGFHSVEKVEDIMKIMEYGVVSTPGLVIDGVVKSTGKLLTVDEVLAYMREL
ncbi:MAG: thioredoxin family protein [Thermoproteota archaeon]|nr:MAG: thioredoxin family protein [Candidatus Korarchaeota archaeon]